MKNKIYIIGPKFSGKTTFIHKLIERDYILFSKFIEESVDIPENIDDALQIYLLLPDNKELEERGGFMSDDDFEKYMEFYCINANTHNITIVKEF